MKKIALILSLAALVLGQNALWAFPPIDDDYLHGVGSQLYDSLDNPVYLTGINWYGFDNSANVVQGLADRNYKGILNDTARLGFNVLRLPLNLAMVYKASQGTAVIPMNVGEVANPELYGLSSIEILDAIIDYCGQIGMKVILDMHSVMPDGYQMPTWYNSGYTTSQWITGWVFLTERYSQRDTVIAMDLKNEPHGSPWKNDQWAIWDNSNAQNNWKKAAEDCAREVLAINPKLLVLVEGTEIYPKPGATWASIEEEDYLHNWWGGNFRGAADYPVNLGTRQAQLVYSPHDYGPSVWVQPWFDSNGDGKADTGWGFDDIYRDCWGPNWMYLFENNQAPLLLGEWGGKIEDPNTVHYLNLLQRLIIENRLNHTFWCLNRDSNDTAGMLIGSRWDELNEPLYDLVEPTLWKDESGRYVGLDHQVLLNNLSANPADIHSNITLFYGGELNTPEPTPSPTPIPQSDYYGQMEVQYLCGDSALIASQLKPQLKVRNLGSRSVALDSLEMIYFYTREGVNTEVYSVDWAPLGVKNVTCDFVENGLAVGFTAAAGELSPGADSGEIQIRFSKSDYSDYDQSNDYSFDAGAKSFTSSEKIVLLLDGKLVWGVPPEGASPPTPTPEDNTPTPTATTAPTPTPEVTPVQTARCGDVNDDGIVNIVDSLLIAQYYVGIQASYFNEANAYVNNDSAINIVDALLVAQAYVGIIDLDC
ncbi:MAG: cellulase family glycosylhydrolase [Spirochaetales bacterium]|nr:cellulase family glycosylhydrolase [Spirochaetales bacterium]